MDEVKKYYQKQLNWDKAIVARIRRLQKEEGLTFDEAAKIVQLELMNQINSEIHGLTEFMY